MGLQDTESESSSEDKKFDETTPVIESSDLNKKSDKVDRRSDVLSNGRDLVATVPENGGTISSSPSEETKNDVKTLGKEEIEESRLVEQMAELNVSGQRCYFELQQTVTRPVPSVKTSRDFDSDDDEPEETNDDDVDSDDDDHVVLAERGKDPKKAERHRYSPFPPATSPLSSPSHQSDYQAQSCTSYQVSHSRALTGGQMEIHPVPRIETADRRLSSSPRNVLQNGGSIIYPDEVRSSTPALTPQISPNANAQFPTINLTVEGFLFAVSNAVPSRPDSTISVYQAFSPLSMPNSYTERRDVAEASPISMYSQGSPSSDESLSPPGSVQSASSSDSTNDLSFPLDIQSRRNSSGADSTESNGNDFARENSFSSSGEGDSSASSDEETSELAFLSNFKFSSDLPDFGDDVGNIINRLTNENNNNANAQHRFNLNEISINTPFHGTANESTSAASFQQNDNRTHGSQKSEKYEKILSTYPKIAPRPDQSTSGTQQTVSVSPIANIQITPVMSAVQLLEARLDRERLRSAQDFARSHPINYFLRGDRHGDTPLHCVMNDNDELIYAVVEKFVENNISLDINNDIRQTPLFCAVVRNSPLVVDYLIRRGANAAHNCSDETTPMHVVAKHGDSHLAVAKVLCEHLRSTPQHLNHKNKDGCTPLVFAVKYCRTKCVDVVTTLLQCGAQIEIPDGRDGKTALHLAVEKGSLELVEAICSSCPSRAVAVNLGTFTQDTVLHVAAKLNSVCDENVQLSIIETLLRCGAKIALNKNNKYPKDLVYKDRKKVKDALTRTRRLVLQEAKFHN